MTPIEQRLVALVARIVPSVQRSEWLAEWLAELAFQRLRVERTRALTVGDRLSLIYRAAGCCSDAITVRGMRARAARAESAEAIIAAKIECENRAVRVPRTDGTVNRLFEDVRFALRLFARRKRFALVLVTSLALGIGSATAIFSIVDGVLWKPLPYESAERLLWFARVDSTYRTNAVLRSTWDRGSMALPDYVAWTEHQRTSDGVAAWYMGTAILPSPQGAEIVRVGRATSSLLPVLGVRPILGRWFLPGEDGATAEAHTVLSFTAWRARYGGDSTVIGRTVQFGTRSFDIVGVMPAHFRAPGERDEPDFWMPAGSARATDWATNNYNFRVIGRLRKGASALQAQQEATQWLVGANAPHVAVRTEQLQMETTRSVNAPLTLLMWSVLLLLGISCVNVAILLVGESESRAGEMATRVALGASSKRIVRQLFTEHLLLAAAGGLSGTLVAQIAIRVLRGNAPADIPHIAQAQLDWRALVFAFAVIVCIALICTLAPVATLVVRGSQGRGLSAGIAQGNKRRGVVQRYGVFAQTTLVVALMCASVLLIRTHQRLLAVDPGFDAPRVTSMQLQLNGAGTRYRDAESRQVLFDELVRRASTAPGVQLAAAAFAVPFQSTSTTTIAVDSDVNPADREIAGTYLVVAGPFFRTMGIALRSGRFLDSTDAASGSSVVISESMARRFWPNVAAIGRRIRVDERWRDIVGVVADVHHKALDEETRNTFYLPATQTSRMLEVLVVRTTADSIAVAGALRQVIRGVDPAIAITRADKLDDSINGTLTNERFRTMLFSFFACAATLLSAVGVYGVTTRTITRRTKELAIRMALGAQRVSVLHAVTSPIIVAAFGGAMCGVAVALAGKQMLAPFLFGIAAWDPPTMIAATVAALCVAGSAAFLPAIRATRIALAVTLRSQ